jgi:sugar phosphate isomerase/epimerase
VGEGRHFLPSAEPTLKALTPSYGLRYTVHAPMSDINIGSLSPRMREAAVREITDTIVSMGRLGLSTLTVHPGFWSPVGRHDPDAVVMAVKDSLAQIDRAAEDHGVHVALENMPDFIMSMGKDPGDLLHLVDGTGLGICFDIGHANTNGNIDLFLEIKDRFINMHVHDNDGSHDQHLPLGEGNIDFRSVLGALNGYPGNLVIEARCYEEAVLSLPRLRGILSSADRS